MAQGDTIHVGQDIFVFDDGKGDASVAQAPAPKAEAKEQAASVVRQVKVNNDLIHFSRMFWAQGGAKGEEVKRWGGPAPSAEDKTFDEGKKYTGKVD
ncbi:dihydrolipoyl dehydrogenase, partial [Mycoplasmopsis synoviae]